MLGDDPDGGHIFTMLFTMLTHGTECNFLTLWALSIVRAAGAGIGTDGRHSRRHSGRSRRGHARTHARTHARSPGATVYRLGGLTAEEGVWWGAAVVICLRSEDDGEAVPCACSGAGLRGSAARRGRYLRQGVRFGRGIRRGGDGRRQSLGSRLSLGEKRSASLAAPTCVHPPASQ